MKDKIAVFVGTAAPSQAVLAATLTEWGEGLKVANMAVALVAGLISIIFLVRRHYLYEKRGWKTKQEIDDE